MTTSTTTLAWHCPVCRSRGEVTAPAGTIAEAIRGAHAAKQPTCEGIPQEDR
jgi:hypothetical protein